MSNLDAIVESLAHIICADFSPSMNKADFDKRSRVDPMWFDGFDVLAGDEDDFILNQSNVLDLPVWPLDVSMASPAAGEGWQNGSWQFTRISTLDKKRWRGSLVRYFPRMVEVGVAVTEPKGWRHSALVPLGLTASGALDCRRNATQGLRIDKPGDFSYALSPCAFSSSFAMRGWDEEMQSVTLAGGLALRRRYHWSVLLGENGSPRARFITDLTGAREAFRLRDLPDGKMRRAALRHWVREHWRKRREPSEGERLWVKQHLRGATSFVWNGLRCEMQAPTFEERPTP
jgi:hypothetical protein